MTIDKKTLDRIAQADKELIEEFGADAFDGFDCRPVNAYPEADRDDVIPDDIKREIEEGNWAKVDRQDVSDTAKDDE